MSAPSSPDYPCRPTIQGHFKLQRPHLSRRAYRMDFTGETQTGEHWRTLKSLTLSEHRHNVGRKILFKKGGEKRWLVKPELNCMFVWYVFSQLKSGGFPKEPAFLGKQTAAESSQYHLWLQDSRSDPPVTKSTPSLQANAHLLNLVGKNKQTCNTHWVDLPWFGHVWEDPRSSSARIGVRWFIRWLQ